MTAVVDPDVLRQRLKRLEEYISDLESVQQTSLKEFKDNKVLRRFVERTLQLAMESCFDIGSHIISASGYREPRFARDVFAILAEHGWFDNELARRLEGMAGFRNVLVHDYATLDDDVVFGVLQTRLPDLRAFGTSILRKLAQNA